MVGRCSGQESGNDHFQYKTRTTSSAISIEINAHSEMKLTEKNTNKIPNWKPNFGDKRVVINPNRLGSHNSGESRHLRIYPSWACSLWSGSKLVIVCKAWWTCELWRQTINQRAEIKLTHKFMYVSPGSLATNAIHSMSHGYLLQPPSFHPTLQSMTVLLYPPRGPELYISSSFGNYHPNVHWA